MSERPKHEAAAQNALEALKKQDRIMRHDVGPKLATDPDCDRAERVIVMMAANNGLHDAHGVEMLPRELKPAEWEKPFAAACLLGQADEGDEGGAGVSFHVDKAVALAKKYVTASHEYEQRHGQRRAYTHGNCPDTYDELRELARLYATFRAHADLVTTYGEPEDWEKVKPWQERADPSWLWRETDRFAHGCLRVTPRNDSDVQLDPQGNLRKRR